MRFRRYRRNRDGCADGARHMPSSGVVVVDGDTLALDKRTIRLRGMGAKRRSTYRSYDHKKTRSAPGFFVVYLKRLEVDF